MKVFFLENENPMRDSSGGIMSYLTNLSTYLEKKEIKTVLCGSGDKVSQLDSFSEFVQISSKNNASNFRYILALFFKINKLKIDKDSYIHAQRPDMLIPAILFNHKSYLVCSLHGAHDKAVFDKKGFFYGLIYSFLQKIAFKFSDLLISVDNKTAQHYINKYPFIKDKIRVVPIAVDTNKFFPINKIKLRKKYKFKSSDDIMIFIGRLEREKNIEFIIDSFLKIKSKNKTAKLLIVGSGRKEKELKVYVESTKCQDVIFMGEVPQKIIPELLNCADVFVFASLYEGSPNVIKEALACNVPVVSLDVGDVKSVIGQIDRCFISNHNVNDFSDNVLKVLLNKNDVNVVSHINQYRKEKIGEMTLRLYSDLLS